MPRLVHRDVLEAQGAIGELSEAEIKILVDRPGEDEPTIAHTFARFREFCARPDFDLGMVQHALEHLRIAFERHRLELVRKISIVAVRAGGHPRRDCGFEFGRVEAPLLAGVVAEELLVEIAPHARDDHVFRGADLVAGLGALREPRFELLARQREAVEAVDRVEIDRYRQEHAVDLRQDAMLVGPPARELRQIVEDRLRVRVEDVRTIGVHQDARRVEPVMRIAADMVAPIDQEHPLAPLTRDAFSQDAAGEAGTDDQPVIHRDPPIPGKDPAVLF
jgi:hypothetical protein